MIGNPSRGDYKGLISSNMIPNRPITTADITNTQDFFGQDLASVRGIAVLHPPVSGGELCGLVILTGSVFYGTVTFRKN